MRETWYDDTVVTVGGECYPVEVSRGYVVAMRCAELPGRCYSARSYEGALAKLVRALERRSATGPAG